MAAAVAMACLVAPASAGGPEGMNGKSLNGLQQNSLTSNSLTSNSLTSNGLGVYALNGVHADGIVLAKSLAPAGKSVVDPNDRNLPAVQHGAGSVIDPNDRNLPAVQKGNSQPANAGKKSNGLPSGHGVGGDNGTNPDRPTPSPRR
ncbi:hypothetical protein [Mesorhizobium helmanticense]|uniref:hypothetical protein n=1 Tax=Mesorhizobium helmanticense TaxID=1776423 RepID=UPI001ABF48E8|nr:hypothetical protein [Mesorhizobium helmanticense]